MKKIFSIFIIFCFAFLSFNCTVEAKEKKEAKTKIKKEKKFNYSKNKDEEVPMGYYGTLPNIEADFKYKKQSSKTSSKSNFKEVDFNEIDEANLKEAPVNDTLFLDNLVKKDNDKSLYLNDLVKMRYALNNLKKCIEENGNIQRFNACVNLVDLYCENLKKKYENTSDSLKESYQDILEANYSAKVLGNLKYNANYYSRLTPTSQGQYSLENIQNQEQKLLSKVNKTLLVIMRESTPEN